uniref:RNase H type-1 domain-containing protein n=1 Tax=Brassica oleracea var. oleracea TaxID=109376 RepID=A0A0D3D8R8_BRAOL
MEALICAMECMRNLHQYQVTFATDFSQLVKMVLELEEWPAFESYPEDIKMLKTCFLSSEIIHVPQTENQKADSLARSAKKQSSFVVHMDVHLPVWFTEPV